MVVYKLTPALHVVFLMIKLELAEPNLWTWSSWSVCHCLLQLYDLNITITYSSNHIPAISLFLLCLLFHPMPLLVLSENSYFLTHCGLFGFLVDTW